MKVIHSTTDDAIRQQARFKLFVEGQPNSIDQEVMRTLLRDIITIETMGPAYHIRSVAEALHPTHPHYFFLADRDDLDEDTVAKSCLPLPGLW